MSKEAKQSSGGIGFFSLLAVLFISLKLTGHIAWSWWWVLAPLWGSITLGLILVVVVMLQRWYGI